MIRITRRRTVVCRTALRRTALRRTALHRTALHRTIVHRIALRWAAVLTLAAFASACTTQEVRPPVELRHYRVEWERAAAPVLDAGGVQVRGLPLTPAQWPLEGSLKRLLQGDFLGVLDALDLRFHPATIPEGVLEDLYDWGFVPAYVRAENPGPEPRAFQPVTGLLLRDGAGTELLAADPDDLPRTFTRVDAERTVLAVMSVALIAVVLIAGRDGRVDVNLGRLNVGVPGHVQAGVFVRPGGDTPLEPSTGFSPAGTGPDRSLLRPGVLPPGAVQEGVVLFRHKGVHVDWRTVRLVAR